MQGSGATKLEQMQWLISTYLFEKQLCNKCNHLSRVARALESGSFNQDHENPYFEVFYLIFELADHDIRAHFDDQDYLDTVFTLKMLHDVSVGISQLHRADIAHQDLKPSNVLVYSNQGSKICDLGRAWDKNSTAPHDECQIAGDRTYSPPELLYGHIPTDQKARRFGCDLYHLGNLIVFSFTRVSINSLVAKNLDGPYRPGFWGGSFEEVMPFLQAAFGEAINEFGAHVPDFLRETLCTFVQQLCDPNPKNRGHNKNKGLNQFGLERFITQFDRLAHQARLESVKSCSKSQKEFENAPIQ